MRPVRVIDTGIRGARANVAFDQALIESREAGRSRSGVSLPDLSRTKMSQPVANAAIRMA